MLRIDNLKLPVGAKEDKLRAACAHALRVSEEALVSVHPVSYTHLTLPTNSRV